MVDNYYLSTPERKGEKASQHQNSTDLGNITGKVENNWAFLDLQNLCKGIEERRWQIDWYEFRKLLRDHFSVTSAFAFVGYIERYKARYKILEDAGIRPIFRKVKCLNGKVDGGNIDADLAFFVGDHKQDYDKAIVVADDGDYCNMFRSLIRQNKLGIIISTHVMRNTSELIKAEVPRELILSIHSVRNLIERRSAA